MLVVVIRTHHGVDIMLFEFGLKHFLVMRNNQFDDGVPKFDIVDRGNGFHLWPKQRRTEANPEIHGCHQILLILLCYSRKMARYKSGFEYEKHLLAISQTTVLLIQMCHENVQEIIIGLGQFFQ